MPAKYITLPALVARGTEMLFELNDGSRVRGRTSWRDCGRRRQLGSGGGQLMLLDLDAGRVRAVPVGGVRAVTASGRRFVVA